MSGFDIVIYIAGILLLSKLFLKELIGVIRLAKSTSYALREPLTPGQRPPALPDTHSKNVSGPATRKTDE